MSSTVITLACSALVAVLGYLFTKSHEREAEWRKDKREYYKAFVASLSSIIEGESTPKGKVEFNRATNNLSLIAPQRVIEALIAFREETSTSNRNRQRDRH